MSQLPGEEYTRGAIMRAVKEDKDLTATLEPEELEIVSEAVANQEADKFAKERILAGEMVTPEEVEGVRGAVKEASMQLRRRSFKGFSPSILALHARTLFAHGNCEHQHAHRQSDRR